jgi:hypothetical protein
MHNYLAQVTDFLSSIFIWDHPKNVDFLNKPTTNYSGMHTIFSFGPFYIDHGK